MKRNILKAINLCALIGLIAVLGYVILVLVNSYREGYSQAQLEINRLSAQARVLVPIDTERDTTNLNSFRQNLTDSAQIKSFVLYKNSGELLYVYARNPAYIQVTETEPSQQFVRKSINLPYSTFFDTTHTVELDDTQRIYGEGVYRVFSQSTLLSTAKLLFIALSGIAILLLISLIIESRHTEQVSLSSPSGAFTSAPEYEYSESIKPEKDDFSEDALYTPDTGLCFEQYLEERLSNELRRAAAFDQDLVLALIKCRNAFEDRSIYIQLSQIIKDHFTFHDLLFEVQPNQVAIILPNTDLEQGIAELSDFQKDLFKKSASDKVCSFSVAIGLSSRNGRLINSARILKEAHTALQKAEKDTETNLVGFRPDPGKFRSFLAAQES